MTQLDSQRFLEMVTNSKLVDPEAYEKFVARVREKCDGELPPNHRRLGQAFVKAGLLTDWHLEKLLAGKYKGFFLGKYKLLGHIGTGGMSSVYLAEHTRMGDKRAIKVLPKSRVKDASYLARFQLEAKAIASLKHPNIVAAYDIDNEGDVHFIVMEYVDGDDLQAIVRSKGPVDFSTAADWISQAADGLQHAHEEGVIHRDVKPANLLIDPSGNVRLLDMGLALVADEDDDSLTVANNENVLGTADYLAPEQALNSHTVDHRADIYGLGCTLYFLLTGQPPFNDGTLAQRIAKHQTEMPKPIRSLRSDCPGELEGICTKMLQKEPKYRYQSAADVRDVLAKFAAAVPKGQPVRAGLGEEPLSSGGGSSSLSFRDSDTTHPTSRGDTVSNKADDTLTSSRSSLLREGLSSNDSGRLVKLQQRVDAADFIDGSFLDLEVESGYRARQASDVRSAPTAATAKVPTGSGATTVGPASSIAGGPPASSPTNRLKSRKQNKGLDPALIIALAVALFVIALVIGFGLAKATS
ncbi:MAG: serine/threonine-protein kinase [Planctomycetota bacterium]